MASYLLLQTFQKCIKKSGSHLGLIRRYALSAHINNRIYIYNYIYIIRLRCSNHEKTQHSRWKVEKLWFSLTWRTPWDPGNACRKGHDSKLLSSPGPKKPVKQLKAVWKWMNPNEMSWINLKHGPNIENKHLQDLVEYFLFSGDVSVKKKNSSGPQGASFWDSWNHVFLSPSQCKGSGCIFCLQDGFLTGLATSTADALQVHATGAAGVHQMQECDILYAHWHRNMFKFWVDSTTYRLFKMSAIPKLFRGP